MTPPAFRADGLDWWIRAGADPVETEARVRAALARPDLAPGRGCRKRVHFLALGAAVAPDHLLKVYRPALLRPRRRSRARWELAVAEALAERGVPVGVPLAAGERRRGGRVVESRLLVPLLAGFVELRSYLGAGQGPGARRQLAEALGSLVRRAHAAGLHQDDLTATNVLVAAADPRALCLIDFERARLRRWVGAAARARMLARLQRSLADGTSAAERWRFLRAYAGPDPEAARRWWSRVAAAAAALAVREHRRLARQGSRVRAPRVSVGAAPVR